MERKWYYTIQDDSLEHFQKAPVYRTWRIEHNPADTKAVCCVQWSLTVSIIEFHALWRYVKAKSSFLMLWLIILDFWSLVPPPCHPSKHRLWSCDWGALPSQSWEELQGAGASLQLCFHHRFSGWPLCQSAGRDLAPNQGKGRWSSKPRGKLMKGEKTSHPSMLTSEPQSLP